MDKNIYLSKKDIPLELIKVTYRTKYINNQLIDFIYDIKSPHNLIKNGII